MLKSVKFDLRVESKEKRNRQEGDKNKKKEVYYCCCYLTPPSVSFFSLRLTKTKNYKKTATFRS